MKAQRFSIPITLLIVLILLIVATDAGSAGSSGNNDQTVDVYDPDEAVSTETSPVNGPIYKPSAVIYDNGPLVNSPGTGAGGADESVLQSTSLGMNTLGFGHQQGLPNRIADDFTIPAGQSWTINSATFFAYQTGSSTTSTITAVNLRIWRGQPGVGGSIVWGNTTTNRLSNTSWSNIYRVSETTGGTTDRPIMADVASLGGLQLCAGTYWLDWQTGGTLSSGPWAPPITINGQATTGNGLQSTNGGATFNPALDSVTLTQQGFPFLLNGSVGQPCSTDTYMPAIANNHTADEPNNACEQAYGLYPNQTYYFFANDSADWYEFDLTGNGTLTVQVSNFVPQSGQLAVYKGTNCGARQVIGNDGSTGTTKTVIAGGQTSGHYYIFVSNDGTPNTTDPYQLSITFP